MIYDRTLTGSLVFLLLLPFLSQALKVQFQLSKDDCVQKCHNKDLLKNASSICADQTNLLCKAKHDCDQDEVCDCSVKFFCDKKKTENDLDYVAETDETIEIVSTEKRLKTRLQKIQKGGQVKMVFQDFKDDNCMKLCKSSTIKNGCNFGFQCGVSANGCRNHICTCIVNVICRTETIFRTLTEVKPTKYLSKAEIIQSAQENVKQVSPTLQKVHIDFSIKENSQCESSCDWVKTGACGLAFGGLFKCQFKIHCTNNICTCHLYADCQKSRHQVQEILQEAPKIIKIGNNDETYQIIDGKLVPSTNTSTTTECLKITQKVSFYELILS